MFQEGQQELMMMMMILRRRVMDGRDFEPCQVVGFVLHSFKPSGFVTRNLAM